jgi:tRNA pseudouridine38-40 synthase
VSFQTQSRVPTHRIVRALNALLPDTVAAVEAHEVPEDFHPRYDAKGKLYRYRILNRQLRSPFIGRYAWHVPRALDLSLMSDVAERLTGRHDFVAFSSSGREVDDSVRDLRRLDVDLAGELVEIHAEADGFLYMMVRRIVGALVDVGVERLSVQEVQGILESRDRCRAKTVAPPQGLSLIRVIY